MDAVRLPAEYPEDLERTTLLRDGTRILIRPIRPEDAPRLADLHGHLSTKTAYERFFTIRPDMSPDWTRYLADVDYRRRMALVAERASVDPPELIAVARYDIDESGCAAEIAAVVADGWQGRGLGTVLLQELLRAGQAGGVQRFRATVLGENRRVLGMLRRHTDIKVCRVERGVLELTFEPRSAASGPG